MVRAKFVCEKAEEGQITLRAVTEGSEENEKFFSFTPSGQISIGTVNEAAAAEFIPGEEYYVDFTKAEKPSEEQTGAEPKDEDE